MNYFSLSDSWIAIITKYNPLPILHMTLVIYDNKRISFDNLLGFLTAVPRWDTTTHEHLSLTRCTITLPSTSIPRLWFAYINMCAYWHVRNSRYDRPHCQPRSLTRVEFKTLEVVRLAFPNKTWDCMPTGPRGMEGYNKIRSPKDHPATTLHPTRQDNEYDAEEATGLCRE